MTKERKIEIIENDYFKDLEKIKETIKQNQNRAMVIVNSAMIMTYYEIGTIINERKSWGSKYIQNLANDLKEYGKGYSMQNLYRMAQIASEYSYNEFLSQPAREIPWFTLVEITHKSSSHEEMLWYVNETHRNGWSRAMVINQFAMKAYERSLIEPSTTEPVRSNDSTNELFKDTYVFSFLDRNRIVSEKDLKEQLIKNVISFLQELGPGFSLVGKEYRLVTPSEKEFFIDLLMYHTKIHCYIVIEVKIGEFSPSDLGQLAFYVNAINKLEKVEGDNETIGLLLCKEADRFVAETTLETSLMKLGISKFKFIEELPEYLNRKMSQKDLQ